MEQIKVLDSLDGKFGAQLKDVNGFLSFSKFYRGQTHFPMGTILNVDIYKTEKGNRYINSAEVVGQDSAPIAETPKRGRPKASAVSPALAPATALPTRPVEQVSKAIANSKVDWDEIGRGKTASLFVEALLSNPNVTQDLDGLDLDKMDKVVWELVDLVFKTRKEIKNG